MSGCFILFDTKSSIILCSDVEPPCSNALYVMCYVFVMCFNVCEQSSVVKATGSRLMVRGYGDQILLFLSYFKKAGTCSLIIARLLFSLTDIVQFV